MSLRLEMLQVARLGPSVLGEEASQLIEAFIRSQQNPDGGFKDRDSTSDLYYTSFAIDALTALQADLPEDSIAAYLNGQFKKISELDFVHLCCLARASSALDSYRGHNRLTPVLNRLEEFRTADGGYNQISDHPTGSTYACFLAWGAYSDHGIPLPRQETLSDCLNSLASEDGAWSNDVEFPVPNAPSTAAAVAVYRNLRLAIPEKTTHWILSCYHPASGGFLAFPDAPMPDLLTTAVALHTLDALQAPLENLREGCLDFIDTLWNAKGGFHGNWSDDQLDVEYTYYGLLALGHLAL
ncbi:MAG: hypothetical protein L3J39_11690 [Verrucomicrobiales bacterium]|nr:hypothetical protein [Verrucomicrobiales bacterium]